MSNPTTDFIEFPDTGTLQEDKTYVIRKDHTLNSSNRVMPSNVTLYFIGGKLNGSSSSPLVGKRTRIIAPIEQIFYTGVVVSGTWDIDRTYPQWFGAQAYPDGVSSVSSLTDSAAAINKAILMKGTGEVFIPRGVYRINNSINVKNGIILTGEPGVNDAFDASPTKYGTIFVPGSAIGNFTDGYIMRVNAKDTGEWEVGFSTFETAIKHIHFDNSKQGYSIANLKGIYSQGSIEVDSCTWYYFKQAIQTGTEYADLKKVTNCSFQGAGNIHSGSVLYAFDLNWLGDALIFEHNAIHSSDATHKALHLALCNGGTIASNIINNDVLIDGCKGIVFSANHMEGGAQITIDSSNITMMNNFIQKGTRPSLVLRSGQNGEYPVVKSSGDLFLFYDQKPGTTPDDIANISEYDIQIDDKCSLQFLQTYRYWVLADVIGKMYTHGVMVCQKVGTPFLPIESFNDFSHFLSSDGRIMPGMKVMNVSSANKLSTPSVYGFGENGDTKWHKASGNYYYGWQIIWDKKRKILGGSGDNMEWVATDPHPIYQHLELNGNGLLINVANAVGNGNQVIIRLYRRTSSSGNYAEYVDIPVTGTTFLYDNGISICGYRWKAWNKVTETGNTNMIFIRYNGDNIESAAPAQPTLGEWQAGDIVYNTGTNASIAHWIYNGSAWLAR